MDRGVYYIGEKKKGEVIGPLWLGKLSDEKILKKMKSPLAKTLLEESKINSPWYFHIHKICSRLGIQSPRTEQIFDKMKKKGFKISKTHFEPLGIKTDADLKSIKKIIQRL